MTAMQETLESVLAALPARLRLFLALWPDQAVADSLAEHARCWSLPSDCLRYAPRDWHVTLHFLGSVASERLPELADALDVSVDPFELVLDAPQLWPRGLAILGATRVPEALHDLHRRLADALAAQDLPVERRTYRPHVTLARRAGAAMPPKDPAAVAWRAQDFVLVVSTGKPDRRYEVICRYPRLRSA
jgi:2'-5' RNA ligase